VSSLALKYAERGWPVFPLYEISESGACACGKEDCESQGKHPRLKHGVKDASTDAGKVGMWWGRWPTANIAVACGGPSGVWVLDVDADKGGIEALAALEVVHGPLPPTLTANTGGGGRHHFWSLPEGRTIKNKVGLRGTDGTRVLGLDVRSVGGYVVLAPSLHVSGRRYGWATSNQPPVPAPDWLLDLVDPPVKSRPVSPPVKRRDGANRYGQGALDKACGRILAATEGERHVVLYREAAAIGELVAGGAIEEAEAVAAMVRAGTAAGKPENEVMRTVRDALDKGAASPRAAPEPTNGAGHQQAPPPTDDDAPPQDEDVPAGPKPAPGATGVAPIGRPHRTDSGSAELLQTLHGEDFRWSDKALGKGWMRWDGTRWKTDTLRSIQRLAGDVARTWHRWAEEDAETAGTKEQIAAAEGAKKWALSCESARSLHAMVDLASVRNGIACDLADFDTDPWLLNCPNLTLNLHPESPGQHRNRREDRVTKRTNAAYRDGAGAPTWTAFLHRIFEGDEEMISFMRRAVGYSLCGVAEEQLFFILHGSGANGKGTFIEAVSHMLGDYATEAAADTFVHRKEESGIPNHLAMLAAVRFVSASETRQGAPLDEALIKRATGGDRIQARFLNREFFEFRPQFTVWMSTNHKPVIKGTEHGIWRRVMFIPFSVQIPREEWDRHIAAKLQAEADGILAWAVQGYVEWRDAGLRPPQRVLAAIADYRAEMDVLAEFLDDRCIVGDTAGGESNTALYTAFREWCERHNENARNHRWFSQALQQRGLRQDPSRKLGRRWLGISLLGQPQQQGFGRNWRSPEPD
jgi:putative DNA primase/helicase